MQKLEKQEQALLAEKEDKVEALRKQSKKNKKMEKKWKELTIKCSE